MGKILLDHGRGGAATQELLSDIFLKHLSSPVLHCLEDSALLEEHAGRLAFSTDSYVNEPIFFPGGNIGSLAVNGTINNLAMRGAMPLALSLSVVIEEGFPAKDLELIIKTVGQATEMAEVAIVAGDTKVVPKGKIRGICLNTSGIGLVPEGTDISGSNALANDAIIVTGPIGEHGLAMRNDVSGRCIASDSQPLHLLINEILQNHPDALHALRDPTRGGLATSLVWLASASGVCMEIDEKMVPVESRVREICLQQSLDPLYLACEGRCVMCCDAEYAIEILALIRGMEVGHGAQIIGHVADAPMGRVRLHKNDGTEAFLNVL